MWVLALVVRAGCRAFDHSETPISVFTPDTFLVRCNAKPRRLAVPNARLNLPDPQTSDERKRSARQIIPELLSGQLH